jgi:Zn-dependent M28 family amino/carboxypeptidase
MVYFLLFVGLVAGLALLAWYRIAGPVGAASAPVPQPKAAPSPAQLRADVAYLSEDCFPRAVHRPEQLFKAGEYVRTRLEGLGYAVEEQGYEAQGAPYRNLIARIGPAEGPLVVVGAHYDACGEQPGADDNASGVAGLLAVAELLQAHAEHLQGPVELVAYTLEEPPFFRTKQMGSWVHARRLKTAGRALKAMICLEMIGYYDDAPGSQAYPAPGLELLYPSKGDFIAVVGRLGEEALVKRVKQAMRAGAGISVYSINAPAGMKGIDQSDHRNYWALGYPAVMVTNTAFFRNPHYHQPTDAPETLDYARMAEVSMGVFQAVLALAGQR